jgi:hypothetical protein
MRLFFASVLILALAPAAFAGETSAPAKVTIEPVAPVTSGDASASAAATVTPGTDSGEPSQSLPGHGDFGGGHGCSRGATTALIN